MGMDMAAVVGVGVAAAGVVNLIFSVVAPAAAGAIAAVAAVAAVPATAV
jgi:hypothetical protein